MKLGHTPDVLTDAGMLTVNSYLRLHPFLFIHRDSRRPFCHVGPNGRQKFQRNDHNRAERPSTFLPHSYVVVMILTTRSRSGLTLTGLRFRSVDPNSVQVPSIQLEQLGSLGLAEYLKRPSLVSYHLDSHTVSSPEILTLREHPPLLQISKRNTPR